MLQKSIMTSSVEYKLQLPGGTNPWLSSLTGVSSRICLWRTDNSGYYNHNPGKFLGNSVEEDIPISHASLVHLHQKASGRGAFSNDKSVKEPPHALFAPFDCVLLKWPKCLIHV